MKYFIVFYKGSPAGTYKLGMPSFYEGDFVIEETVYPSNQKTCEKIKQEKKLNEVCITNIIEVTAEQAEAFQKS